MTLPSGSFLYLVGDIPDTADDRVAPRTCAIKRLCLRTKFSTGRLSADDGQHSHSRMLWQHAPRCNRSLAGKCG